MGKEYARRITIFGIVPFAAPIIFHEDFENTLQWTKTGGEGDSIFELDPSISKNGKQSLHLKTRTTGAAVGDTIGAKRFMYLHPSKHYNLISHFYSTDLTQADHIIFDLAFYDGATVHQATIRLRPRIPDIQYRNSLNIYTTIPNSELSLNNLSWHQAIFNVNFDLKKYISLTIDHTLLDISLLPYSSDSSTIDAHLETHIQIKGATGFPTEIYLDDITLHEI